MRPRPNIAWSSGLRNSESRRRFLAERRRLRPKSVLRLAFPDQRVVRQVIQCDWGARTQSGRGMHAYDLGVLWVRPRLSPKMNPLWVRVLDLLTVYSRTCEIDAGV